MKTTLRKIYRKMRNIDYWILIPYLVLCLIGVVMVYSASAAIRMQTGGSPVNYLIKQIVFVLMGWGVFGFFASLNLNKLRAKGVLGSFFWILLGALLFVKVAGRAVNGANGWINLGPISIQPAEFTKLFMIVYWADRCTKVNDELHRPSMQDYVSGLILTAILLILIIIQPDVGGFSINFAIAALIIMASGYNSRWTILIFDGLLLIGMVALPSLAKVVATGHIKNYQVARFVAFVNPFGTQSGAGSQLVNSYYAISNGGLKGVGLGNGIQKMGYLPEPNTDFILSVVSEELGFIGVFLILALLAVIICQIIRVGVRSDNMYEGLLCYGVGTFIAVEAAINVGGVTGLLPITGVTFPFISYGGSSMIALSIALGLAMNVSIRQKLRRKNQRRLQAIRQRRIG